MPVDNAARAAICSTIRRHESGAACLACVITQACGKAAAAGAVKESSAKIWRGLVCKMRGDFAEKTVAELMQFLFAHAADARKIASLAG